jgi:hypothetical protein
MWVEKAVQSRHGSLVGLAWVRFESYRSQTRTTARSGPREAHRQIRRVDIGNIVARLARHWFSLIRRQHRLLVCVQTLS